MAGAGQNQQGDVGNLPLIEPDWPAPDNVRACSTTRSGGVSKPPFDSLNLGQATTDDTDSVATNRTRLVTV